MGTMDDKENEKSENTMKKSNKHFVKKKKKIKSKQQTKSNSNMKAKVTVLQKNQPIKAIDNMKIGSSMNKSAIMTNGDQMRKENVMLDASQRPATASSKAKKSNQQLRQQQEEEIKVNASHPSNNSIIPEQISLTLEHMVNQLTIITQTLGVFEESLSMHEDRVANVETMMTSFLQSQGNTMAADKH